jgi:hypothetical protein
MYLRIAYSLFTMLPDTLGSLYIQSYLFSFCRQVFFFSLVFFVHVSFKSAGRLGR